MIKQKEHIKKIDSLRGIAILGVFLFHAQIMLLSEYNSDKYGENGFLIISGFKKYIYNFSPISFGWTGVELFLIISGFLIHYGYLSKSNEFKATNFYQRRFWRIYPPYLLALIYCSFLGMGIRYYFFSVEGFSDFCSHIFFLHNLRGKFFFNINASFWSLALEMQLYFLYPLILLMRDKIGISKTFFTILILSFILLGIGMISEDSIPFFKSPTYERSVFKYWFIWCSGALLAESYFMRIKIFKKYEVFIFLIGFFLTVTSKGNKYTNYFTVYFVTISWLAFFEWYLSTNKINSNNYPVKFLSVLGICSYSFYLFHFSLLGYFLNYFDLFGQSSSSIILRVTISFFLIFFISYFLYLIIEKPSISLGQKLMSKK